eukprot:s3596_g1.t1
MPSLLQTINLGDYRYGTADLFELEALTSLDDFVALGLTAFLRSRCWEPKVFNQSDGPGLVDRAPISLSILAFPHSFVGISASQ